MAYNKIAGSVNPADMGTKHLDSEAIRRHMLSWNLEFMEGRSAVAPGKTEWGPQPEEKSTGAAEVGTAVNSLTGGGSFQLWGGAGTRTHLGQWGSSGKEKVGRRGGGMYSVDFQQNRNHGGGSGRGGYPTRTWRSEAIPNQSP